MNAGLRAFLTGLIDYAGLFPPAKLPMAEALANYLRYRESEDAWMLGRFVCPASRLKEIPEGITLTCSAIGRGGSTDREFRTAIEADLEAIKASPLRVEVLEVKVPAGALEDHEIFGGLIDDVLARVRPTKLALFLEPPTLDRDAVRLFLNVLAEYDPGDSLGLKLRTGGLEPQAFPSCEQLAFALSHAAGEGLPFKATAGLHHPFPGFDPSVKARMHGFLNVFAAGVLGQACGSREEVMRAILEDDDPANFRFGDGGLTWRDLHATTEQIAAARRQSALSFGSCSFDEPREDLRALGWM